MLRSNSRHPAERLAVRTRWSPHIPVTLRSEAFPTVTLLSGTIPTVTLRSEATRRVQKSHLNSCGVWIPAKSGWCPPRNDI
jgi:hypothetical protein